MILRRVSTKIQTDQLMPRMLYTSLGMKNQPQMIPNINYAVTKKEGNGLVTQCFEQYRPSYSENFALQCDIIKPKTATNRLSGQTVLGMLKIWLK